MAFLIRFNLHYFYPYILPWVEDLRWMANPLVRYLRNVNHPFDPADVDKRAKACQFRNLSFTLKVWFQNGQGLF